MTVERADAVSDELVAALGRLLPQLSTNRTAPSREHLAAVLADPRTALLVARDEDGAIVGTLTLAARRKPSAYEGWIEDVVVDDSARGRGIGEALTREAMRLAGEWGLDAVKLTSRPFRESAIRLYRRLGFEPVETNVYVWPLR